MRDNFSELINKYTSSFFHFRMTCSNGYLNEAVYFVPTSNVQLMKHTRKCPRRNEEFYQRRRRWHGRRTWQFSPTWIVVSVSSFAGFHFCSEKISVFSWLEMFDKKNHPYTIATYNPGGCATSSLLQKHSPVDSRNGARKKISCEPNCHWACE